jgi:hypothetical protein
MSLTKTKPTAVNGTRSQAKRSESVASCDKIRSTSPVSGDWYSARYDHSNHEWWIERVMLWALVENYDQVDHVCGICSNGMPDQDDAEDIHYVHGPDMSPIGKTWNEVYLNAASSGQRRVTQYNITDQIKEPYI